MSAHELALEALPEALSPEDALALLARLASASTTEPAPATTTGGGARGLRDALIVLIAEVLKLAPEEVRPEQPLIELGLDSISATDLIGRFNEEHDLSIPSTIMFEFDNVADLSTHLWETHHPCLSARYGTGDSAPPARPVPTPVAAPPAALAVVRAPAPATPTIAQPDAAPSRRMDVKAIWAEIEARLVDQPPPAPTSALPDANIWSACETSLAQLLPGARSIAVPDRGAALTLLRSAGGAAGSRCIWLGSGATEGLESIDPQGDEALEELLEAQGEELIVCLSASDAPNALPSHLRRALERMRERNRGLLAVFADGPQHTDGAALRALGCNALIVGEAPMMAAAIGPALAERLDGGRLERLQSAYRNDWSAAQLLHSLTRLNGDARP